MNNFALSLLLLGALSTGAQLPFWVGANQYGLMPEGSGGLALFRAGTEYDATKEFQWKWGVSLAGQYDSRDVPEKTADFSAMVDELYASARWKALRLDAGLKHVDIDFLGAGMPSLGSMSTTGGHIVWSGNARTMPGYLITMDPVAVPFTHQVLWVHGAFGDGSDDKDRWVSDIYGGVENNRIKAHHLSLSGKAFHKSPYKLMLTYTQNFGTYWTPYTGDSQISQPWGTVHETPLHQVSAAFIGELPFYSHLTLTYSLFADRGQLLPDAFGATVGVRWGLK